MTDRGRLRLDGEAWLDVDWVRAAKYNQQLIAGGELEEAVKCCERSPVKACRTLASWIRAHMPYQFDGDEHEILDYDGCLVRGYGACADAAALASVCLLSAGHVGVKLCYETVPSFPDYAHVRVFAGESLVEPWPEVRRPVQRCTRLLDVQLLLA